MKLCVIGASGGTGLAFVRRALTHRHQVVALLRDGSRLPDGVGASTVVGDVRDREAVVRAVRGCDAVACLLGVRLGQAPGTTRSHGTEVLIDAMTAAGVGRLVAVSAVGARQGRAQQSLASRWLLPIIVGRDRLAEVDRQESSVMASALDWCLVRPPRLVDTPGSGRWRVGPDQRAGLGSQLPRADLAAFLLDEIERPRFARTAVAIVAG